MQQPHPPVLVGGNGPGTEDRVLAFGDGWLPQYGRLASVEELAQRIAALRRRATEAGRGYLPVTVFGLPPEPEPLPALAAAGADRALFPILNRDAGEVLSQLDTCAALLDG